MRKVGGLEQVDRMLRDAVLCEIIDERLGIDAVLFGLR